MSSRFSLSPPPRLVFHHLQANSRATYAVAILARWAPCLSPSAAAQQFYGCLAVERASKWRHLRIWKHVFLWYYYAQRVCIFPMGLHFAFFSLPSNSLPPESAGIV
ncbi:hypothetical protein DFH06DRAFT_1324148 [Mycena polygramma]|nr:hypothetical protein DFH06DRAFT_1324148 [Mycena polygramma]